MGIIRCKIVPSDDSCSGCDIDGLSLPKVSEWAQKVEPFGAHLLRLCESFVPSPSGLAWHTKNAHVRGPWDTGVVLELDGFSVGGKDAVLFEGYGTRMSVPYFIITGSGLTIV